MIAARITPSPIVDLDRYCLETRDALAAALGIAANEIDHNLDAVWDEVAGDADQVIWHELLVGIDASAVSAFHWDPADGWFYSTGPFNNMDQARNRWHKLDARADCTPAAFGAAAAAVCGRAICCIHCRRRVHLYGGVWFQVSGGGATCHQAPDKQHTPVRPAP